MVRKDGTNYQMAREELRLWLAKYAGCESQSGYVRGEKEDYGWPCGTCLIYLLGKIGLISRKKEYQEHNDKVDRANEVWRAVLQIRDAKLK